MLLAPVLALALALFAGLDADEALAQRLAAEIKPVMASDEGNCLACHAIADGELPGTIEPPLLYLQ